MAKVKTLRDYAREYQLGEDHGAWVDSDPEHGDYQRRHGFRRAGQLLLAQAAGARNDHSLIYPALTVYRHYYELALKELVRISATVLQEPTAPKLRHGLPDLLDYVARAVEVVWPDDDEGFQPLREAVDFLHGVDPSAQVFRYSTLSRSGDLSVPEPGFLNPIWVAEFLGAGADVIEGADTGLSVWIDQRNEYLSDMYEYEQQMHQ